MELNRTVNDSGRNVILLSGGLFCVIPARFSKVIIKVRPKISDKIIFFVKLRTHMYGSLLTCSFSVDQ